MTAGPGDAGGEAGRDGVGDRRHDDGDLLRLGRLLGDGDGRSRRGDDHVDATIDVGFRRLACAFYVAAGEGHQQLEVAPLDIAVGLQAFAQAGDVGRLHERWPPAQQADDDFLAILRQGNDRKRGGRCRKQQATVELHGQYMCWPPLIDSVEPVMKPASSATRNITPRAISSALPSRPTGILATIFSSTLAGTAATMSVSV